MTLREYLELAIPFAVVALVATAALRALGGFRRPRS